MMARRTRARGKREASGRAAQAVLAAMIGATAWLGGWATGLLAQEAGGEKPAASSNAAIEQFNVAIGFQNMQKWQLAADEYADFLKQYAGDPLAPKARHYLGVCLVQLKDYARAADELAAALKANDKSELADETHLQLGLAHFNLAKAADAPGADAKVKAAKGERLKQALAALTAVPTKFAKSKRVPEALFYAGEANYLAGDKAAAVTQYQKLVQDHSAHKLVPDALYSLGFAQEELGQGPAATKTYDTFLEKFSQHELAVDVTLRKGETLLAAKDYAAAAELFAQAAAAPNFAQADHALFQQAACAWEQQQFEPAAKLYLSVAAKYPNSPDAVLAQLNGGRAWLRLKKYDAAREPLLAVAARSGVDKEMLAEAVHLAARCWIAEKQGAPALALVKKHAPAAAGSKWEPHLLLDQADAMFEVADQRAAAGAVYATVAEKFPQSTVAAEALYMAGFTALQTGDAAAVDKYADQFEQTFAKHRLAPSVLANRAEAKLLQSQPAEAEKLFARLVQQQGDHADAPFWKRRLGYALYAQEKWDAAATQLAALAGDAKDAAATAEVQYLLGDSQRRLAKHDAAIQAYTAALKADPNARYSQLARLGWAESLAAQKQWAPAIAKVREAIAEFKQPPKPNKDEFEFRAQAHYRLGSYLAQSGDRAAAIESYQRVGEGNIYEPYALRGIGLAHFAGKDYAAADKAFSALVEKHPQHALARDVLFDRGQARQAAQQYKEALVDLNAYLATKPAGDTKWYALHLAGICQDRTGDHAAAVKTLQSVLDGAPQYAETPGVLFELAWSCKAAKQDAAAAAAFARLAQDFPNSSYAVEAQFQLGEARYAAKEYEQAVAAYQAAAKSLPADELGEKILHKLGWAQFRRQQYADAEKSFTDQLRRWKTGPLAADAAFMLGEVQFQQQKYEPALKAYQHALGQKLSSNDMRELSWLHGGQSASQLKKWTDAIDLLEKLVQGAPKSYYLPDALYEQGWAKKNLADEAEEAKRTDEAGKLLDEAAKLFDAAATKALDLKGNDQAIGARARFMAGEVYFQKKDHRTALRHLFRVANGYGTPDKAAPEVKKWKAKATYELGRLYEVLKQVDDAKQSYQQVLDQYGDSDVAATAKQRLAALGGK